MWIGLRLPDLANDLDVALAGIGGPPPQAIKRRTAITTPPATAPPRHTMAAMPAGQASVKIVLPVALITPLPATMPANPPRHLLGAWDSGAAAGDCERAEPSQSPPPPSAATAFDLATRAYAGLAVGDRRAADRLFREAIAKAALDDPLRAEWVRARQRLTRQWSGDAYMLFRDAGGTGPAASPVLGGGQSGASLAFAIDPLARRPLAFIGRLYAAHTSSGTIDKDTAQGAIGLRWQAAPGITIAAERLIAIGNATSGDWNVRLAGGGEDQQGAVKLTAYGEAGVRGNGDIYAGGQASAMIAVVKANRMVFSVGPSAWTSVQQAEMRVSRLDVGVGVIGSLPLGTAISADWRWRIAGNADPVSGPAVTISVAF